MRHLTVPHRSIAVALGVCGLVGSAVGQSAVPAVFVSNNGNLEGSVSSLRLLPDRSLQFVQKLVLGSTPSTQMPVPGTNAYAIDISPNGRWLMVSHTTANQVVEQLSLIEIHADASISLAATFQTPDSPLDLKWVRDDLVAVTQTQAFGFNAVRMYAFDDESLALSLVNSVAAGSFCSSLAVHPNGEWLIAEDSTGYVVRAFSIGADGTLALAATVGTNPIHPLGIGISPDGRHLYAGGGISNGGKRVVGIAIDPDTAAMAVLPDSPFDSPGSSPKQIAVTGDGAFAAAAHGTDATIRTFTRDDDTGALAATGIGPEGIALWLIGPAVFGDLNDDGVVDGADLGTLLQNWGNFGGPADLNGDGIVDGADLGELLTAWSTP